MHRYNFLHSDTVIPCTGVDHVLCSCTVYSGQVQKIFSVIFCSCCNHMMSRLAEVAGQDYYEYETTAEVTTAEGTTGPG